jgi:cytochrome c1
VRWAAVLLFVAGGCTRAPAAEPHFTVSGADATRGRQAIRSYGCGSCHMIPGIREARGTVGPPLLAWGRRTFIAGEAPNTPDQLVRWIRTPQAIEPGTAMPNLGVNDQDARDIAAYLYTLR